MAKLSFFGGAREVTGANYLLETGGKRLLIDCGLFQCPQFCSAKNRDNFSYDPKSIDALFVTHAHIDHTGRIPKLVRGGFSGNIYSTPPTRDFAELMLEDSLGVLEKEAKNDSTSVFYETKDIEGAMKIWHGVPYGESVQMGEVEVVLRNSGHILGASMVEVIQKQGNAEMKLLFTGDLGNAPMPLLDAPEDVTGVNVLIIESAYGNRAHEEKNNRKIHLERAIEDVVRRKGTLIMPAFALERTQELLYEFNDLVEHGRIPRVPIFIDSPLAIKATAIYKKYKSYFGRSAQLLMGKDDDLLKFPDLHFTLETKQSREINNVPSPKVILAGAGMMQGGRILHHARRYLSDERNMIIFIGYAAAGSTARRILDGERRVTIMGERVPVRAEVRSVQGYSAHADMNALYSFVESNADTLKTVFVVQGEPASSLFLVQRIRDNLGIEAHSPELGQEFQI